MDNHSQELRSPRNHGFLVTAKIDSAHPTQEDYPLLPGDLVLKSSDGSYNKYFPGLAIMGFQLTPEQEATLKPVEYTARGLSYHIHEED